MSTHSQVGRVVSFLPDDVEALQTIGAAIGQGCSRLDREVLREKGDQMGGAATVDTGEGLRGPAQPIVLPAESNCSAASTTRPAIPTSAFFM